MNLFDGLEFFDDDSLSDLYLEIQEKVLEQTKQLRAIREELESRGVSL